MAQLKVRSMESVQWDGGDGQLNWSLFALSEDGMVYRWGHSKNHWIPLSMEIGEAQPSVVRAPRRRV